MSEYVWIVWAVLLDAYGGGRTERASWVFDDKDDAERFLLFIRQDNRTKSSGMRRGIDPER